MIMSPLILAIDTSCDDTSAAVTHGTTILSNVVASQTQLHKQYGGVFPTVAKQAHKENIGPVIALALKRAKKTFADVSAIAVTQGPGLAPALEVGIEKAKALALEHDLPLIPVNHIEGHALSVLAQPKNRAEKNGLRFPILSIVVSGGHTEFILIRALGEYQRLGFTVDDAAGEALDKFGRMIDLGYPAGPIIEEFAKKGDHKKYTFPLPMTTSGDFNLSFSGMKTAARKLTEELATKKVLSQQDTYDLCASFQYAVFRSITYKLNKILQSQQIFGIWLGGGVASNMNLRAAIRQTIRPYHLSLKVPYAKKLCSDNAAMIGVAAKFQFQRENKVIGDEIKNIQRLPRWEIDRSLFSFHKF